MVASRSRGLAGALLLAAAALKASVWPNRSSAIDRFLEVQRSLKFPGHRRLSREVRNDLINYPRLADDGLQLMILKQQLYDGDRSHPSIVELDNTKKFLTYPGWRVDAAKAEMVFGFGTLRDIDQTISAMKRKQEFHGRQPPNAFTVACISAASHADLAFHSSVERFGMFPTFIGAVFLPMWLVGGA